MEILRLEEREVLLLASGFLSLEVFMSFTAASFNHLPEAAAVCTFYIKKKIASLSHLETLLLLLSCFSHVQLCATPWTAAHQASQSLGFSRQEHWNRVPFPSPMHESEK